MSNEPDTGTLRHGDSFDGAEEMAKLNPTRPSFADLDAAAERVLETIERTREYLNQQDRDKLGHVANPRRLADVVAELKAEYIVDGSTEDPLETEVALIFQGANFDRAADARLAEIDKIPEHQRDEPTWKLQKNLKLLSAKFLGGLRETIDNFPDLSRDQLEDWLWRASGDREYAKRRMTGLAAEIATYEALLDLEDIVSIRFGTPEEDVKGIDLVIKLRGRERPIWVDVKSSIPKDAVADSYTYDVKNSIIRVWLPSSQVHDFAWTEPENVREFYRDTAFHLI